MEKKSLIYQLGKMLKFDDVYIKQLEERYLKANEDERYRIMEILWDNFQQMMDNMIMVTYKYYLNEVTSGKRKVSSDIYQQAVDYVKEFLLKSLEGTVDDELKIEEIRRKIMEYAMKKAN